MREPLEVFTASSEGSHTSYLARTTPDGDGGDCSSCCYCGYARTNMCFLAASLVAISTPRQPQPSQLLELSL